MKVVLVMFSSDGERRNFPLGRDMTVIGRREDCDVRIPLGDVSRKHCRLVKDDVVLRIEDLGSSNGTYRNGERVQESEIAAGDTIKVGPVRFVVQIDGAPADAELSPYDSGSPLAAAAADAEPVEAQEVTTDVAMEEFDPMSALAGSDSGLSLDGGPPPGESLIPLDDSTASEEK